MRSGVRMRVAVVSGLRHRPDSGGPGLGGHDGSPRVLSGCTVRAEGPSLPHLPRLLRAKLRVAVVHGGFSGHRGPEASRVRVSGVCMARGACCVLCGRGGWDVRMLVAVTDRPGTACDLAEGVR